MIQIFFFQYRAVLIDGQSISDSYDFDSKCANFLMLYWYKLYILLYCCIILAHILCHSTLSSFSQFLNP